MVLEGQLVRGIRELGGKELGSGVSLYFSVLPCITLLAMGSFLICAIFKTNLSPCVT